MFDDSTSSSAKNERAQILEQARRERAARKAERTTARHASLLQRFARRWWLEVWLLRLFIDHRKCARRRRP